MARFLVELLAASSVLCFCMSEASAIPRNEKQSSCQKTRVAILGAGVSGITAAQALSNASISDFVIVDRNDYIGGRMRHTSFGKSADGTPYTVELGANWIEGLGSAATHENPIAILAEKYGIKSTYANYSSILTYDQDGPSDYLDLIEDFDDKFTIAQQNAGYILTDNLQDTSVRAGLNMAGWKPKKDMHKQTVEWWGWDFEVAWPPEQSGLLFGMAGDNATFTYYNDVSNLVWDQRGYNTIMVEEAKEFLKHNDPRLRLNTTIKSIHYGHDGVKVGLHDGSCIEAEHAICTFSVGVLQNDVVEFKPELPKWKREAIEQFQMGTYTKIFMQFNETFWPKDTQYFLYSDPEERGHYPLFQSISGPGFVEGSNILIGTVVTSQAYRIEQQSDEKTKNEIMEVLRSMFPEKNVPEPTDFMYPRWNMEE